MFGALNAAVKFRSEVMSRDVVVVKLLKVAKVEKGVIGASVVGRA